LKGVGGAEAQGLLDKEMLARGDGGVDERQVAVGFRADDDGGNVGIVPNGVEIGSGLGAEFCGARGLVIPNPFGSDVGAFA